MHGQDLLKLAALTIIIILFKLLDSLKVDLLKNNAAGTSRKTQVLYTQQRGYDKQLYGNKQLHGNDKRTQQRQMTQNEYDDK